MELKDLTSAYTLANGIAIPAVGYGTFRTPATVARQAVKTAIEVGYRHIDTAAVYENEEAVGQGIKDSGIDRDSIFLTSKLWNTERGYDKTIAAFEASLKRLQTTYLDLYLIHWPANQKQFGDQAAALNAETWRALEDLYKQRKVKAIGLSYLRRPRYRAFPRQCTRDAQPDGTTELGANDDSSQSFSPYNNFYYIPQAELHAQFDMKDGAAEPYREFPVRLCCTVFHIKLGMKFRLRNIIEIIIWAERLAGVIVSSQFGRTVRLCISRALARESSVTWSPEIRQPDRLNLALLVEVF